MNILFSFNIKFNMSIYIHQSKYSQYLDGKNCSFITFRFLSFTILLTSADNIQVCFLVISVLFVFFQGYIATK